MGNKNISTNIEIPNRYVEIKQQYFNLLYLSFLYHQNIISNYKLNKEFCFRKNFKNYNFKNKQRDYLNWKIYLYNFFEKRSRKGHEFYNDIIHELKKEKFGFEEYYLSFMFYVDYENTYNSNNKDNIFKKYIEEDDLDYEKQLKSRLSRSVSIDYSSSTQRERSKSLIEVPICNNLEEQEENDKNDYNSEQKKRRKQVIYLAKIIKSQLEEKNHPINIVITIFEKYISSIVEDYIANCKANIKKKDEFQKAIENLSKTVITNIQKFAVRIHTAVKLFYSKVIHLDCFMEEKDELINIIMTILFNTGSLYQTIHNLFKIQYQQNIKDFKNILEIIKNLTTKDIQIDDKFCLDKNTDRLINELKQKYKKGQKEKNNHEDKKKNEEGNNNIILKDDNDVYNKAINILRNLAKTKSPYKKMLLIASISTEITRCVDDYWADLEDIIPSREYLQLNSDEILKIFIYIVVHAQFPELIIHEKFVDNFTFSLTKSTMIGFYNSTLDAAINYIQNNLLTDVNFGITEEFRKSIMEDIKSLSDRKDDNEIEMGQNNKLYESIDGIEEEIISSNNLGKQYGKEVNLVNSYNISSTYNANNSKNLKTSMIDLFNMTK